MTYSLCMTTVNRPDRAHTFRRLVESGTLEHPLVKGFHLAYDRLPNANADHALGLAMQDQTDWIIFLEDDIDLVDGFITSVDNWMRSYETTRVHMYPMGCGVRRAYLRERDAGGRMWEWPLKDYFGATALVLRPTFALAFREEFRRQPEWWTEPTGLDENLKQFHRRYEPTVSHIRTPIPCLVDHRGVVTTQTTAAPHWTGSYPGWIGVQGQYP